MGLNVPLLLLELALAVDRREGGWEEEISGSEY